VDKDREFLSILIATPDEALGSRWTEIFFSEACIYTATSLFRAKKVIHRYRPLVALLDHTIFADDDKSVIEQFHNMSPGTRYLVLSSSNDETSQVSAVKSGAHGCCDRGTSADMLRKAVTAVRNGEIWIARKLIPRLIGELARETKYPDLAFSDVQKRAFDRLTPREYEVARMVHMGGNNKIIARELDISERTVKAHLSAIFRKLSIENRLHLALLFKESGK
jgi:two-component system nitrate/nitrite response regulator NarL